MTKSRNEKLLDAQKLGNWVRTKTPPYRAVKWVPEKHPDGRQSLRGRRWEEILPYGEERDPERYFADDVELAPAAVPLGYYPAVDSPICGYLLRLEPEPAYCARPRKPGERAFCVKHETELAQGEETHGHDQ